MNRITEPMASDVLHHRLPNGLVVLCEPVPHVESVAAGIWLACGSRHERAGEEGMAHFLEHMLFKGTRRRSAGDIAREIEDVGGHLDAHTGRDHTAYYGRVLAGDLGLLLDLIADMLRAPAFAPQELARERDVVLQEIAEIEDAPEELVFDRLQAVAFPDQPLGRPVLGSRASVRRFEAATLRRFMARGYRMEGAVLSIAGRVDPDRLLTRIEDLFSPLASGPAPAGEPARWQGGASLLTRECEQAHCVLALPGVGIRDEDFFAFQLHATLLGGGMSSRLFQEIREERGLAYSVHAHGACWTDTGMLTMAAGAPAGAVADVLRLMWREAWDSMRAAGCEEVERARAQLRAGMLMARESLAARAEQMARQWLHHGRVIPVAEIVARLDAVEASDLRRLAERIEAQDRPPALAIVGPAAATAVALPEELGLEAAA